MTAPDVVMGEAARQPAARRGRLVGALAPLVAIAGCFVPLVVTSPLTLSLLTQALIGALLATGVGFLVRQNGMVSFGHALFYGLAGYIFGVTVMRGYLPIELALIAALVVPTLLAFLLGLVITRIPGVAFGMLTLACAQAFYEMALKVRGLANGDDGLAITFPSRVFGIDVTLFQDPHAMFVVCWVVLMIVLGGLWLLMRSPFGLLTAAIKTNEERARFIGYETLLPRAAIFALSALLAAIAGVLATFYNAFISPDMLHWTLSGSALIMAIIGGTAAVWGPALGAIVFFFIKEIAGDATEHWPAVIGAILIVVTVFVPAGLSGLLARLVAGRRR
ncbi:branched-chain amino acid ABC transporter permease [Bradyrhizobium sp. U87765 SZCCT0131]|uniref:branched-chain amino acid ABC transporter permease n=1 Tax=unclassified Bradyrhizobium TaxID=2631580 RepID=UPI001BA86CDE|nr:MULTISPECIES: branched-chain amino acid ABC transporter permease [unclassified Bradyrhizobium]MBR1219782.1 branched-chain amino acid ABC transporter permease [Bradyrhizobium sp. U87765 SZCCT0131]MBR1262433.1 branched-chain amino acid ABC transporter permease [Bradyrhizobium sp. U87765 SZCCT0134]MBR1308384.1 branched-chain amino acid ABC transporter permease [Bradyrhizobium sp. U87765 SZCCT0110]MBR1318215.1 branched-chain amino acid ABC transporter permease [Bradyrhizobium sp. U87765 SZCCT010